MKFSLIILIILFQKYSVLNAIDFDFKILSSTNTSKIHYKNTYDHLLPSMIRTSYTKNSDSLEKQISTINDFLYKWNSAIPYEDYNGLGTGNIENTSTMMAFDFMYCSEIARITAVAFRFKHNVSRLDIINHTVFEIQDNKTKRWIIADPLYNPKITNSKNQLVTFNEMKLGVKKIKSLRMDKNEFNSYVNLFDESKYIAKTKEDYIKHPRLRKTSFGTRKIYPKMYPNNVTKKQPTEIAKYFKDHNIGINSEQSQLLILGYYYLPFVYNIYTATIQRNAKKNYIYDIQDKFLNLIKKEYSGNHWSKAYYKIWEARQYQILGRFKKAEKIFIELLPLKNINKKQLNEYIRIGIELNKIY